MGLVRILIVDDEPPARERLRQLAAQEEGVEVAGLCGDAAEAAEAIKRIRPDLVFLDVQMPHGGGFGVIESVGAERMPLTIFVTAYDDHALHAFETGAVDYLVKPFDDDRFFRSLERARQMLATRDAAEFGKRLQAVAAALAPGHQPVPAASGKFLDRLVIKNGHRVSLLPVTDIDWIGGAGPYAEVHAGQQMHTLRISLTELESRLDPQFFQRIHRSTIVNIDRVRELQEYFRGEYIAILVDGTKLKLSRGRRAALEERLGQAI